MAIPAFKKRRVLVGAIHFEGNSFNGLLTDRQHFRVFRGQDMLLNARKAQTSLGGIVRKLESLGYECVPTLDADARPGGPIVQSVYDELATSLMEKVRSEAFDAVCLFLHGACLSTEVKDTEGDLLESVRTTVGQDVPIAVALDLHGYITERMVRNATIVTGYRTNPHSDMVETGERAATYLDWILNAGLSPRAVFARIPYLTRGSDESTAEPLLSINALARRWMAKPDIIDVSIFNILPFVDAKGAGQVVLAYDRGDGRAVEAATEISNAIWDARDEFTESLPSVEEALALAASGRSLFALGDNGDSVVSGAPGDSVEIARVAIESFPALKLATVALDPKAVQEAWRAGEGAELEIAVGGSFTGHIRPLKKRWKVVRTGPTEFTRSGAYMRGSTVDFGNGAVLSNGNVTVVVTEESPAVLDPAFYEAMGIPIAQQDVAVAKSANHYKLAFEGVAETITVDTPGLSAFRLHEFPFSDAHPVYPLDDVAWDPSAAIKVV